MQRDKWRNFGKFLGAYFLALLAIAITTTLLSCDKVSKYYDTEQSTEQVEQIAAEPNLVFETVGDLIDYKFAQCEEYSVDSTFRAMSTTVLTNVGEVVLKKNGNITKKSIVEEYRANRSIYDNLPNSTQIQSTNAATTVDLGSTDLGSKREEDDIISTSYSYRTDTVNGKVRKIQIKKEEKYAE